MLCWCCFIRLNFLKNAGSLSLVLDLRRRERFTSGSAGANEKLDVCGGEAGFFFSKFNTGSKTSLSLLWQLHVASAFHQLTYPWARVDAWCSASAPSSFSAASFSSSSSGIWSQRLLLTHSASCSRRRPSTQVTRRHRGQLTLSSRLLTCDMLSKQGSQKVCLQCSTRGIRSLLE